MASNPRVEELRKKFDENPRRYFAPLANEYRKAGDFAQAIAICREYLPQQPGHMSGHIVFGQALYEARQFDEAKTVFETALSLDPENLIALKHLGDIELIAGKTESARAWYKKILDADPRNEEILAQLAKLEQKAAGAKVGATMVMQAVPRPGTAPKAPSAPKPADPSAPPTPPSQSAPTPVITPAVARPPAAAAAPPPAPAAPVTADSPTQEIRLDTIPTHAPPSPPAAVEPALGLEPTSMGGSVEPQSFSTSPTIEIDTPVSAAREAPPLDSLSLEGLETTSLTADARPSYAAPPPPAPVVAEAPAEGLVDLDISIPATAEAPAPPPAPPVASAAETVELDFAPPATPPATPAPEPEPPVAEAIDLDFAPPAAPAPAPSPEPPAAAASDDLPLLDLGGGEPAAAPVAEPPVVEAVAPPPPSPVIDFAPPAMDEPAAEPVSVEEAAPPVAAATDSSSAFVTETMAELYLKQGHKEEALKVYLALLEKRPGDAGLTAKIASLQAPPAPTPRTGPSIREMLHMVALRRPGYRPAAPANGNGATHAATVGPDGLSHLFGGAAVSPADDAAAHALATAFTEQNGHDSILAGAPARPAAGDLSLNTVFSSDNPAPPPPPANFSFDQFFSRRATAEHDAQPSAERATESKEDVAQFSQWLEGLKQK